MNSPLLEILPRIDAFRKQYPGSEVWLCAKNMDTRAAFGVGEKERVRTASTIKLPIMAAAFRLASEGKLKMDEKVTMRAEDRVSGSGIIREFAPGSQFTIRDLIHVMIVVSDNTATNLVLDRITADYVNACLDDWGYPGTRSMRKVRGDGNQLKEASGFSKAGLDPANEKFGLGSATSADMVSLLERIERGEIVSPEASKEMIAILDRQQYKTGIGRRVSERMRVVSKSGALDALRSDVGIVYSPGGRIALALTVDGMPIRNYLPDNAGTILIADLADLLIEGLAKTK